MSGPKVTIACSINGNYALPLLVMLSSLIDHLRTECRPVLYLVHRGLHHDLLTIIGSLLETHPILQTSSSLNGLPRHPRFPPEAAVPLLLTELLPADLDRVLFLDADLLVLDDAALLWEIPDGRHALAAVSDPAIPFCRSPRGVKMADELGIAPGAAYFNAGVMLIDLGGWRERDVSGRACDYLRRVGPRADFLHQEALNAVLSRDWLPLAARWNLSASLAGRPYDPSPSGHWRVPGIVHFSGRFKPWRLRTGSPFDQHYRAALSRVAQWVPAGKPTARERLLSIYDQYLRNSLYGCERGLWNRRVI
jgi:lipopolysaccharide biosynthesis glycosyltransferase